MLLNIIYLISIVLAGSVTTAMATHLWINRKIIEPDLSIILLIGLWVWIAAQIGECLFSPLAVKILFYKVKFSGISVVSAAWLSFCLQFTGKKQRFQLRLLILLLIFPMIFNLLSFFPFFERMAWRNFFLAPNNLILDSEPSLGYFAFNIYCVILIVIGFFIIVRSVLLNKNLIRARMMPFLFVAFLSTTAGIADFFLKKELLYYRFLPIALALSSLTVIYYLRLRYFRTVPLAQHVVIESMSDSLIILSPDDRVVYMNPSAHALFDIPPILVIGRPLEGSLQGLNTIIGRITRLKKQNEIAFFAGSIYDVRLSLIRNRGGKTVNRVIALRDVTELKRAEENLRQMKEKLEVKVDERTSELAEINAALKAEIGERQRTEEKLQTSLEEKNILFGELHHRVKNNLQVVSSLLKLQANYITDPEARELFEISVSRIRSIALVHEKLYKSKDISRTQFKDYINELVQSVVFSHAKSNDQIRLNLDVEPVSLDIDKSILSGLIVNELVINSLKHAFPQEDSGKREAGNEISIEFKAANEYYSLTVSDNGKGMSADFNIETAPSLGMKIIMTLVNQLKGSIEFTPGAGSRIQILFPKTETS